jgi:tRNA (Thr-GGU) A37 N-methylase
LTLESGNTYGIFATRSQLRPNHLGVSVVPLLGREGTTLRVRGLDAVDGTPVLDIKPYLPEYDAVPGARTP